MNEDEKQVRIVEDSISYLINGTGEDEQPGVAEIHAGLSPEDVRLLQSRKARLVAAIVDNGGKIIDIIPPPPPPPPQIPDSGDFEPHGDPISIVGGGHIEQDPVADGNTGHTDRDPIIDGNTDYGGNDPRPPKDPDHNDEWEPVIGGGYIATDKPTPNKDDDDRRTILGIPFVGKILGIGATLGLALLLSQCQGSEKDQSGNPFIDTHEEHHIEQSNVYQVSEIADLYFESDEYLRGSQVRCPGELIDELRNASWSENLGRKAGREEYDSRDSNERENEERRIQELNKQFEEQSKIIQDNKSIIENPSSTPQQIEQALKAIRSAKIKQRGIYMEYSPLIEKYYNDAVSAVSDPSDLDDRTESEIKEYSGVYSQYKDGAENLNRDIQRLGGIIDTYLHPEEYAGEYFEQTPEEAFDAEDKGDAINTLEALSPFGHRAVTDSRVSTGVDSQPNSAGQVHEGLIGTTQTREVTVTETRYGISAIVHKIGDFFNDLGHDVSEKFGSLFGSIDQPGNIDQSNDSIPQSHPHIEDEER